jgi:hypothetical protein
MRTKVIYAPGFRSLPLATERSSMAKKVIYASSIASQPAAAGQGKSDMLHSTAMIALDAAASWHRLPGPTQRSEVSADGHDARRA